MSILVKKYKGVPHLTGIAKLSIVGLIASFSAAALNTIWAIYLNQFLNSAAVVGFFSAILTVVAFLSYFLFIPVVEKHDKAKLFSWSLVLFTVFYLIFAFVTHIYLVIALATILAVLVTLRVTSYGLLVRDISSQKKLSKNEGLVYSFANFSFVVAPLIAGFIAAKYGMSWVFILSAASLFVGYIIFKATKIKDTIGKKRLDTNPVKNFLAFFKDKHRTIAYALGTGISIWWILIYLYIPLWMIKQGFTTLHVGYFLFAVAIPLILFEYYFSSLAGKKGFKPIFLISHLFVGILAVICFFLTSSIAILAVLVLASIGLAMLEPTTESYFFDLLKGKERYRFYGPYNTALDTGSLIGKLAGAVLLLILPFKFLFLLFGAFMFLLFFLSFKTKKIIEAKRKKFK